MTAALPDLRADFRIERRFGMALLVLAGLLAILMSPIGITAMLRFGMIEAAEIDRVIKWLIGAELAVASLFAVIILRRLLILWRQRRQGVAGAKLLTKLVGMFGVIALIPTLVISVASTVLFVIVLNVWFQERIQSAMVNSLVVSQSYLDEARQRIAQDTLALAGVLVTDDHADANALAAALDREALQRDFFEVIVLDRNLNVLARGGFISDPEPNLGLQPENFIHADQGQVDSWLTRGEGQVRALVSFDAFNGTYLYASRQIDAEVLAAVRGNRNAVGLYRAIEQSRSGLQWLIAMIFAALALLLLFAAVWYAIVTASQLARPVSRLAAAAQSIGGGNLSARVKIGKRDDELTALSRSFNEMAGKLQSQQSALIAANREGDERRRFIELVLAGVTAGVIGLDEAGRVEIANRSAWELLGETRDSLIGRPLTALHPEMAGIAEAARRRESGIADGQVALIRAGAQHLLHVRAAVEDDEGDAARLVVTFDDVTELLAAQRKAAWADIARRIAHEIKNPLTPIQLSAERLKRKYLRQIAEDPETFAVCTDTIIRQVGDIGRLVDEFSAFARMPAPVLAPEDAAALARQAFFLQQGAHPDIAYSHDLPTAGARILCDAGQFGRAVTNLLQNAAEAIAGRHEAERAAGLPLTPGRIHLWIREEGEDLALGVEDNGKGLPESGRERLTEPYVTTRAKGTGLGLAIVKKIMEDHGGRLVLGDRAGGGAAVRLIFPRPAWPVAAAS